ncbi:hypothetical protein V2J09_016458 [Rumex salicifolius]
MAIRTICKRALQFRGSSFKGLDLLNSMDEIRTASAIRGYSSIFSNSHKFNSFSSRYIDNRNGSFNSMNFISFSRHVDTRQISQLASLNRKRVFLVDTLALVRRLESKGVPTKEAEAITENVIEVLNGSMENVSHEIKAEMQKMLMPPVGAFCLNTLYWPIAMSPHEILEFIEMSLESSLSKFKSEVKSSQEHLSAMLQRETERLKVDAEKMRTDLKLPPESFYPANCHLLKYNSNSHWSVHISCRHEIDKVTAGQRLDLNLERGRIRDELAERSAEASNFNNKHEREIHELKAHIETTKFDLIKYCVGTLLSVLAVGLALLRYNQGK